MRPRTQNRRHRDNGSSPVDDEHYVPEPSLGELLEQAIRESLIDECTLSSDRVTVRQGGKHRVFDFEKARAYLLGLLQGWWTLVPGLAEGSAQRGWSSTADPVEEEHPPQGEAPPTEIVDLEGFVDALIHFAEERGIVDGAERDAEERVVLVRLSEGTSDTMSYAEAASFLADSILYELRCRYRSGRA